MLAYTNHFFLTKHRSPHTSMLQQALSKMQLDCRYLQGFHPNQKLLSQKILKASQQQPISPSNMPKYSQLFLNSFSTPFAQTYIIILPLQFCYVKQQCHLLQKNFKTLKNSLIFFIFQPFFDKKIFKISRKWSKKFHSIPRSWMSQNQSFRMQKLS